MTDYPPLGPNGPIKDPNNDKPKVPVNLKSHWAIL